MEFSKRFKIEEVWPADLHRQEARSARQDAVRRAVPQRTAVDKYPASSGGGRLRQRDSKAFGF
jgi:hypothetical protein